MSGINVPELVKQVGLEELAKMGQDELVDDFLPAAVVGFADGDLLAIHEPYTGQKAELYGESHLGEGKVARLMAKAALENGMRPGNIYNFQGFAAKYALRPESPFSAFQPEGSVKIHPEAVEIDGNPIVLEQPPTLVFDYAACLTGRSYLNDQMRFRQQGKRPFTYSPLTRLHFTNQLIIDSYDATYGRGISQQFIANQWYIGREDGITGATNEIIKAQKMFNAPTEIADVILCTGSQHSTEADLRPGIANAHTLLKEGGMLVIRSLSRPAEDEIGTNTIAGWAYEAGFQEKDAIHYDADLNNPGTLIVSGHFGEREIQTVILKK